MSERHNYMLPIRRKYMDNGKDGTRAPLRECVGNRLAYRTWEQVSQMARAIAGINGNQWSDKIPQEKKERALQIADRLCMTICELCSEKENKEETGRYTMTGAMIYEESAEEHL